MSCKLLPYMLSNANILKLEFISFAGRKLVGMLFYNNLLVISRLLFHALRAVSFFVANLFVETKDLWR